MTWTATESDDCAFVAWEVKYKAIVCPYNATNVALIPGRKNHEVVKTDDVAGWKDSVAPLGCEDLTNKDTVSCTARELIDGTTYLDRGIIHQAPRST